MQQRRLGRSPLSIAPLMLGGNVFGWTADRRTSFAVLDAFAEAGFNAIDTADMYSRWVPGHAGGESETLIGEWLKARGGRDRVIIATKLGMDMGGDRRGLSRSYMARAVEDSLRRLQTDYIDLYQAHQDDPEAPLEETLQGFAELIRAGKVRVIGASNYGAARLREAVRLSERLGLPRYETLQPHYNLVERAGYEAELQPVCMAEDISVIPYFSLASGFLTGKYRGPADFSKSPRGGDMQKYLDARGRAVLAALDDVAARHGATPAQVALAWLMARPTIAAPIASATSVEQLREILAAATLTLRPEDIAALDEASAAPEAVPTAAQ
jgi:aryl-alcohol dehydrogenase-like predicted oxidoreductase